MSKSNHFYESFEVVGIWLSLEGIEDTLLQYFSVFHTTENFLLICEYCNNELDSGTIFPKFCLYGATISQDFLDARRSQGHI